MYSLAKKSRIKLLLTTFLLFSLAIIAVLFSYIFYNNYKIKSLQKENENFAKFVRDDILSRTKNENSLRYVEEQLKILTDLKLSKKTRYNALSSLAFFYSNEYSLTNDPSIRLVSKNVLGKYGEDNFSDLYNDSVFTFICADPNCGQPIDTRIQKALNLINKSETMSNIAKITIADNLRNAGYMTDINERQFGIKLSISQLNNEESSEASEAAKILIDYLNQEYKYSELDLPK